MTYSSHIKHNVLKNLVQKEVPCEEKLDEIRKLLGLKPLDTEPQSENQGGEEGGG